MDKIKALWAKFLAKIDAMEQATDQSMEKLAAHEHTARWVVLGSFIAGLGAVLLLMRGCT